MKWNVTSLIRRGSDFYFFAALYCSHLGFNVLLTLSIKALNQFLGIFQVKLFFENCGHYCIRGGRIRLEVDNEDFMNSKVITIKLTLLMSIT